MKTVFKSMVPASWRNPWRCVHKSGVSAEPEISERMIYEFDDFFILATDGLWDVVDNYNAVQIIHSFVAKTSN